MFILNKIFELVTRNFILIKFQGNNFNTKRKNKHCMERKKVRSGSNPMILIHSNVSKFLKKLHTNMLYCFANRISLDESNNSMNEKFFLKKIEVTRFIGILSLILRMSTALMFHIVSCKNLVSLKQPI